jgi:hypothetical protein
MPKTKNSNQAQKELMRDLTDVLIAFAKKSIKDVKATTENASVPKNLIDTKNLQDSQVYVPKKPTLTKAEVIISEAYYAPYVGSINKRANSYLKDHIREGQKELNKNIKVTVDKHIKILLNVKK